MARLLEIEEAEIIEEHTLSDSGSDFTGWLARQADRLTKGNRAGWITEGLILSEFALNEDELRKAYEENKDALNDYFDQVDIEKVINESGAGKSLEIAMAERVKNNLPGFAAGTLAAAGVFALIKYKNKQS